ncbi:hypothetical protein BV898_17545 [Hypsibius exemplaris]|uniref:Uncharacterized protein n=1 Tax=Hypsibius exemplaris TaxID=2072580 RepID=A0A9X6NF97_HYPEX|nr:hypothetical protein BV898_17545 [Hypsibius exemplaris]
MTCKQAQEAIMLEGHEGHEGPSKRKLPVPSNLERQVFCFQRRCLQIFGLVSSRARSIPFIRVAQWLLSVAILIGAFAEIFYQFTILGCELGLSTTSAEHRNVILIFLSYGPYIAQSARGVVVMILIVAKRKDWQHLAHFSDDVVDATFPDGTARERQLKSWKKFAIKFGVVTIALHLIWEAKEDFHKQMTNQTNASGDVPVVNECRNMEPAHLWEYMLGAAAETIPFCLSQQIFGVLIVLALVLVAGGRCLNAKIVDLKRQADQQLAVESSGGAVHHVPWRERECSEIGPCSWDPRELTKRVADMQRFHLRLVLLGHEVNHVFGGVLFFQYGMDVVTLIGFVALMVTKPDQVPAERAMFLVSILTFGAFVTLFYVPLVQSHEQATAVITNLRDLLKTTAKLRGKEPQTQSWFKTFLSLTRADSIHEHEPLSHERFDSRARAALTRADSSAADAEIHVSIFAFSDAVTNLSIAVLCYELLNLHILEK